MKNFLTTLLLHRLNTVFPILIFLIMLAAMSLAATQYHDFLLKDGRSFRGRVVAYDQHADIVSIERADKRLIKTTLSVFDKADQAHINEWNMIRHAEAERWLKISVSKNPIKGDKGATFFTYPYNQILHFQYTISLENNSKIALKNMTVEYRVFYTQEYRENYRDKGWNTDEGVKCGAITIAMLKPKSKQELVTADIMINKIEIYGLSISDFMWPTNSSKPSASKPVDVLGIWVRITLPLSNDRKVVRNYCRPDTLSKHHEWPTKDVPAGVNKYQKKRP